MSTELYPACNGDLSLTRFWGGAERGVCAQLTRINQEGKVGFFDVNREEAAELAMLLLMFSQSAELSVEPGQSHGEYMEEMLSDAAPTQGGV
jgi:hypothetical protein